MGRNWLLKGLVAFGICLFPVFLDFAQAAERRWVVMPFENLSDSPQYHWLGEGLATLLSDSLSVPGVDMITPRERLAVIDSLSFPRTAILSHASAIRIAQDARADLLLVGRFEVSGPEEGEQISLSARLVDIKGGHLAQEPFEIRSPLAGLIETQAVLAWEILLSQRIPVPVSRNDFISRFSNVGLRTIEAYVAAMLPRDHLVRAELLELALERQSLAASEAGFCPVLFEMGMICFQRRDYAKAVSFFRQIKPGRIYYRDSQFYLGLSFNQLGQLDPALAVFALLADLVPVSSVYNNLAVLEIRQRQWSKALDHLILALGMDRENANIWFNYGYALWVGEDFDDAAARFEETVRLNPEDGEAKYLLAKCLISLNRAGEAKTLMDAARTMLPATENWERMGEVPVLARLTGGLDRPHRNRTSPERQADSWSEDLVVTAEHFLGKGYNKEATVILEEVIRKRPDAVRAHYLLAEVYDREKDWLRAVTELKAATFWDPKMVDGYIALGKVYQELNESELARESLRKALSLDPHNKEAHALMQRVEASIKNDDPRPE